MRKPLIGLVIMGKNEQSVIARAMTSALPYIDFWTYCDTGSTDDTLKIMRTFLEQKPGKIFRHKWRNFGYNLTLAHKRAQGTAKWLLWIHADMTVHAVDELIPWLKRKRKDPDFYWTGVISGDFRYELPLMMRGDLDWRYLGPTHEYLEVGHRGGHHLNGLWVEHFGDGGNRAEKFERDIELLRDGFRARDPRSIFYTAESHRHLGHVEHAALIYDLRAEMNGWEEEKWYAKYQAARLRQDVEGLLEVWRERPWRHEPLTEAGRIVSKLNPTAMGDMLFREVLK